MCVCVCVCKRAHKCAHMEVRAHSVFDHLSRLSGLEASILVVQYLLNMQKHAETPSIKPKPKIVNQMGCQSLKDSDGTNSFCVLPSIQGLPSY